MHVLAQVAHAHSEEGRRVAYHDEWILKTILKNKEIHNIKKSHSGAEEKEEHLRRKSAS